MKLFFLRIMHLIMIMIYIKKHNSPFAQLINISSKYTEYCFVTYTSIERYILTYTF